MNLILISALFAYGMFTVQRPGFLLDFMPKLWKKFPKGLHEPLYACGVCTSSIWGGFCFLYQMFFLTAIDNPKLLVLAWLPIVAICCAGAQAMFDRFVKACEKHYGYKPASLNVDPSKKWDYLLPYEEMRTLMATSFVHQAWATERTVIEVGGCHKEWISAALGMSLKSGRGALYEWFDATRKLVYKSQLSGFSDYDVVILGLAYDGDLRVLRELIENAGKVFIEYSDDGISRDQIAKVTEGLNVKLVIPEYEINVPDKQAPAACGVVSKRKIIMIDNAKAK